MNSTFSSGNRKQGTKSSGPIVAPHQIHFPAEFSNQKSQKDLSSSPQGLLKGSGRIEFQKRLNKSIEEPKKRSNPPKKRNMAFPSKQDKKKSASAFNSSFHERNGDMVRESWDSPQVNGGMQDDSTYGASAKAMAIINKCKKTKTPFTDPDFPPAPKSLFVDPRNPPEWPEIEWKRISEFVSKPQMFIEGVEPGDVIQGILGDCWFLGALSVVATREDLLFKLVPQHFLNEWGVYEFFFHKNGDWISVIIDDYIPLNKNTQKPAFSTCLDPNEVWVMLIEKAYAKVHQCYENLEGGSGLYALVDLTGGAPQTFELDGKVKDLTWEKMVKYFESDYLACSALLLPEAGMEEDNGKGILINHAYGVLGLKEIPEGKLIRVRNPWGQTEWRGKWSDESPEWNDRILKLLDYQFADDGTFWIEFSDFVENFNRMYFLHLFDAEWKPFYFKGEWKGSNAGGCGNFPTWKNNPQYGFEIAEDTTVFISLMQRDYKMEGKPDGTTNIGFIVLKTDDLTKPLPSINPANVVVQVKFNSGREVSKKCQLKRGKYVLSPSTFHPNQESTYYVRLYAQSDSELSVVELGKGPLTSIHNRQVTNFSLGAPSGSSRHFNRPTTAPMTHSPGPNVPKSSTPSKQNGVNFSPTPKSRGSPFPSAASPRESPKGKNKIAAKVPSLPLSSSLDTSKISSQQLRQMSPETLNELRNEISHLLNVEPDHETPRRRKAYELEKSVESISRRVSILASPEYKFEILQLNHQPKGKKGKKEGAIAEFMAMAQNALRRGQTREEAACYYRIANACMDEGAFEEAVGYYQKFLAVVKEVEDVLAEALAYNHLGIALFYLGGERNLTQALKYHGRHFEATSDPGSRFVASCNIGLVWVALGDHTTAIVHLRQALGSAVQLGDVEAQSLVCDYLAMAALDQNDLQVAQVFLERRMKLLETMGDQLGLAYAHQQMGDVLLSLQQMIQEQAKQHFQEALLLAQRQNNSEAVRLAQSRLEMSNNQSSRVPLARQSGFGFVANTKTSFVQSRDWEEDAVELDSPRDMRRVSRDGLRISQDARMSQENQRTYVEEPKQAWGPTGFLKDHKEDIGLLSMTDLAKFKTKQFPMTLSELVERDREAELLTNRSTASEYSILGDLTFPAKRIEGKERNEDSGETYLRFDAVDDVDGHEIESDYDSDIEAELGLAKDIDKLMKLDRGTS